MRGRETEQKRHKMPKRGRSAKDGRWGGAAHCRNRLVTTNGEDVAEVRGGDENEVLLHHSWSTMISAPRRPDKIRSTCARTKVLWTGCVCIGTACVSMTRSQAAEGTSNGRFARCGAGMWLLPWLAIGVGWGEVVHAACGGAAAPCRTAQIMKTARGAGEQRMAASRSRAARRRANAFRGALHRASGA